MTPQRPTPSIRLVDTGLPIMPPSTDVSEQRFWIGLACAGVLHAAVLLSLVSSNPRVLGDPGGQAEGIGVEIIDAADVDSGSSVGDQSSPPPTPMPQPVPPQIAQPTPAQQPVPPAQPVQPPAQPPPQPHAEAEQPPPEKPSPAKTALNETTDPDLFSLSSPAPPRNAKEQPPKKDQPQPKDQASPKPTKPPEKSARLDLTPPKDMLGGSESSGGTYSATTTRPAGITRSGQNDEFGRQVIRALKATMPPPPRDTLGRVTIRILLSTDGNVSNVQVIRNSDSSELDQSVLFAAKQTSYPIPPGGSTLDDRIFVVTYIYH